MGIFAPKGLQDQLDRVEAKLDKLLRVQEEEIHALREDLLAAVSPQAYALRHRGDGKVTTDMVAENLAHPRVPPSPRTPSALRRMEYHPGPDEVAG